MKRIALIIICVLPSLIRTATATGTMNMTGETDPCANTFETYFVDYGIVTYPGDFSSFVSDDFTWSATGGHITGPQPTAFPSENVLWDSDCKSGEVRCVYTLYYIDTSGAPKSEDYLATRSVSIHKLDAGIGITQGVSMVDCNDRTLVEFRCTQACATYFDWTVPTGWTVVSGHHDKIMRVRPDNVNGGIVKVTASHPKCGSQSVSSADYPVTRTCEINVSITTQNQVKPHTVASNSITVDNSAGAHLTVSAGTSVRMKAANRITIRKNFHAENGSEFVAKLGPCTSCLALRKKRPEEEGNEDREEPYIPVEDPFSIRVCPNPSTGMYTLNIEGDTERLRGLNQLAVYSTGGRLVTEQGFHAAQAPLPIDLTREPDGTYILVLSTAVGRYTEKLIKQ